MDMLPLIEKLGAAGVMAVGLIYLLKFMTRDFKDEIDEMKGILIKLIDKVSRLKDSVDSKWKA